MAWTMLEYNIIDFPRWKAVFDSLDSKKKYGWRGYKIFKRVNGTSNDYIVLEEFQTLDQAQAWDSSNTFTKALHLANVRFVLTFPTSFLELIQES